MLVFICIAYTRERALEIGGPSLTWRFGTLERALEVSIVGTPADAVERLVALHQAGVRYVHLRPVTRDAAAWKAMAQWIASDVLPPVRHRVRSIRQ